MGAQLVNVYIEKSNSHPDTATLTTSMHQAAFVEQGTSLSSDYTGKTSVEQHQNVTVPKANKESI